MRSRQERERGALEEVVRVGIALFALAVLAALLGLFKDYRFSHWPFLLELLGASTLLLGIIGILRKVSASPQTAASTFAGDIALVLAGGMVLGGGWAAALGLGAIAVAGLLAERRNKADEGDPSA